MSIDALKARLPEAFRDARLNLSALASEEVLAEPTKWGLLFACAIATRNAEVRDAFAAEAAARLPEDVQQAARAAATVMAMNNV
jgi:alkyl hydroperoxide reductase subunit D